MRFPWLSSWGAIALLLTGCPRGEESSVKATPPAPLSAPAASSGCLAAGQESSIGGVPGPNGWELRDTCCEGLSDVESLKVCGKGHGGGYVYVCTNCGDSVCDAHESPCNCPQDCPKD